MRAEHKKLCLVADLEDAVFAAHVENSSNKPLRELIEEIMGDHEMVVSLLSLETSFSFPFSFFLFPFCFL